MKVTKGIITLIKNRLRDSSKRKINQSQLAEHMGLGKAWASKLMTGKLQTLSDEHVEQIEEFLGIRLGAFAANEQTPAAALAIAQKMEQSQHIARIVGALLEIDICDGETGTRWIDPSDMTRIGGEILKIAQANPDKPGKVAKLVLQLLN